MICSWCHLLLHFVFFLSHKTRGECRNKRTNTNLNTEKWINVYSKQYCLDILFSYFGETESGSAPGDRVTRLLDMKVVTRVFKTLASTAPDKCLSDTAKSLPLTCLFQILSSQWHWQVSFTYCQVIPLINVFQILSGYCHWQVSFNCFQTVSSHCQR